MADDHKQSDQSRDAEIVLSVDDLKAEATPAAEAEMVKGGLGVPLNPPLNPPLPPGVPIPYPNATSSRGVG